MRKLPEEDQTNANVIHFMSADIPDWFLCAAELTVACVEPAGLDGPPLQEPGHQDGGASVCHMGITLYGSRTLRCWQPDDDTPAGRQSFLLERTPPLRRTALAEAGLTVGGFRGRGLQDHPFPFLASLRGFPAGSRLQGSGVLSLSPGRPDVVIENTPGTVYLGGLSGPWHQVGLRS